jgi:hypothetical protein
VSSPMLVGAEFAGRFSGGIGKGIMMEGRTELRREPSCFDLKRVSFSGQNANADLSTRLVEGGDDVQIKDERGAASWKTRERSWSNRSFSLFSFLFSLSIFSRRLSLERLHRESEGRGGTLCKKRGKFGKEARRGPRLVGRRRRDIETCADKSTITYCTALQ